MSPQKVVISGISGRYPKADNLREFGQNLYNKIEVIDGDESRWKKVYSEVPQRFGKINGLEKFDGQFFSVLKRNGDFIDPQVRIKTLRLSFISMQFQE